MIIKDEIYGEHEFSDVFAEIINCKEIQRLKKIHQNGADFLIDQNRRASRYDHSIGVMILAKIFGGSVESQLCGLLHDVSHTVFSHTVDVALKNVNQDYHELIKKKILDNSDVIQVLKKYNLDVEKITDEENFSLIDCSSPDLCADRLDYFLRDMYNMNFLSFDEIKMILDNLEFDKVIKCKNLNVGKFIVEKFIKLNEKIFFKTDFEVANIVMSKIIQKMIEDSIITEDDFMKNDDEFIEIIKSSSYNDFLSQIKPGIEFYESNNGIEIKRKPRYVDPLIGVSRISELDEFTQNLINDYLKKTHSGFYKIPLLDTI